MPTQMGNVRLVILLKAGHLQKIIVLWEELALMWSTQFLPVSIHQRVHKRLQMHWLKMMSTIMVRLMPTQMGNVRSVILLKAGHLQEIIVLWEELVRMWSTQFLRADIHQQVRKRLQMY